MLGSPKRSALISACIHGSAILLIVTLTSVPNNIITKRLTGPIFVPVDLNPYRAAPREHYGGGGGGRRDPAPARFGRLARFAPREFVAPTTHLPDAPAPLMFEPAILADAAPSVQPIDLSKLGIPNGVRSGNSGGSGSGNGIGDGSGGGVGSRNGPGYGNDEGPGGISSGTAGTSGPATAPVLLWKSEPEYSEEARRAKLQGTVMLRIEIDAQGRPRNPRVLQSLGLGLDERAIETVMRWKFKAATRDGRAVASVATVEVSFRLL